jgi:hypothetical protein
MRISTRIAGVALLIYGLATLPSYCDEGPSAQLLGDRCEVLRGGETAPGIPGSMVLVCQIVDDGSPTGTSRQYSGGPDTVTPTLDSLLNLLTLLDNARHEASLQRHDAVVRTPAP